MARTTIFEAGDMNAKGICRALVCDWITKGQAGVDVKSKYDFDSTWENQRKWILGDSIAPNVGIDQVYGLVAANTVQNNNPPIDTDWIAAGLTRGTGYFMFAVRGKMLNIQTRRYDNSGHAMGTRKGLGAFQFFDPNLGLIEFGSTLEFYDYLPGYVATYYPSLLSRQAEVQRFNP
jgi:hypothetical protein